jgi:hypothetical protein
MLTKKINLKNLFIRLVESLSFKMSYSGNVNIIVN